ncbi:glycosyltransferase [Vibrio sp. HI00D65]|uniref:glycosyltransferase n=1 Tax=Vibrio sp. HI00D65 TaxID=1822216 RepID=UPI0007BAAF9F|nr:glycosyltransferase [Vibrio sp. HI00D65]KZX69965.1 glycosyltransferase [Vibrio sp. HI00D65]
MNVKKISVIIPAHNEEGYIRSSIESVINASRNIKIETEIVVVLNNCTDNTESIAKFYDVTLVKEETPNISRVRNTGIKNASGDVIVTLDADNTMDPGVLAEVVRQLETGKYIGGGIIARPDRYSVGILITALLAISIIFLKMRVSLVLFWAKKKDIERIGYFDEDLLMAEDIDFALRLKELAKRRNLKYGTISRSKVTCSTRKFDQFGDFFALKLNFKELLKGKNKELSDRYWYKTGR